MFYSVIRHSFFNPHPFELYPHTHTDPALTSFVEVMGRKAGQKQRLRVAWPDSDPEYQRQRFVNAKNVADLLSVQGERVSTKDSLETERKRIQASQDALTAGQNKLLSDQADIQKKELELINDRAAVDSQKATLDSLKVRPHSTKVFVYPTRFFKSLHTLFNTYLD
jgi:hypothetical protein